MIGFETVRRNAVRALLLVVVVSAYGSLTGCHEKVVEEDHHGDWHDRDRHEDHHEDHRDWDHH